MKTSAWNENDGYLFYLMKQLGHTTLALSKRYVVADTNDLQAVHKKQELCYGCGNAFLVILNHVEVETVEVAFSDLLENGFQYKRKASMN